ncbi:MAG: exonuclease V subunit gamma, partial [Gammaproteobacteria bacterium]|nr:exonuclease V subunit gamma [Gammaproteobacteria bacterium]
MAIEIEAGNRLETLAERLADEIRRSPLDPFEPERIVVPHPTLGRWLVLALAKELGIAANVSIELPAQFAWSIMH